MTADFVPFCMVKFHFFLYYQINKVFRIYAILCHAEIIYGKYASNIVKKISQQMAKLCQKLKRPFSCCFMGLAAWTKRNEWM